MKSKIITLLNIFLVAVASMVGGFLLSAVVFTDASDTISQKIGEASRNTAKASERVVMGGVGVVRESLKGLVSRTPKINGADMNSFNGDEESNEAVELARAGNDQGDYINFIKHDITNEAKAMVANLEEMTLSLYENGQKVEEYPILSKGRPGSPWETPSGKYKVLYKEESHFSSIGKVYMPSSIQFFGNFFIHGWPYYPDGTPVSEGYSGGCIRLSMEDAAKVFEFADNGIPVVVYGSNTEEGVSEARGEGRYVIEDGSYLDLRAGSYLIADLETGEIIVEKARSQIKPIASVSKIMTALVSLEVINQYQEARITSEVVSTEGFAGGLFVGQRIQTGDLLYPLMLESSNDAAEALARHYGRKYFIEQMNNKAKSIGLNSTFFEDPSGLSPENVSSAEDLFVLAQHIYRNKKHIFDVSLMPTYKGESQVWGNISKFLDYKGYLGDKNGYTDEAGKTVVSLFSLPLAEFEDRKIAIILLNTNDIQRDVDRTLGFLEKQVFYERVVKQANRQ